MQEVPSGIKVSTTPSHWVQAPTWGYSFGVQFEGVGNGRDVSRYYNRLRRYNKVIIKLKTNIEIEECKRRINNTIDSRPLSLLFSPIEVVGKVRAEKFWLHKRTINFRNPLTRIFYGSISKDSNGSVIEGSFKVFLFVKIIMVVYFAGLITLGGFLAVAIFSEMIQDNLLITEDGLIFSLLAIILMLLFGVFIFRYGAKLSEKEEKYLIMFLEDTLNAKKVDN